MDGAMSETSKLSSDYHTPSSSASYGGVSRLKRLNPHTSTNQINKFLQAQDVYTKHKRIVHKFQRRKVMVPGRNYLWQVDLVILNKLARFNKGYHYLLNCIDAFSRYAFSIPIKKKTGEEVCKAFSKILKSRYGKCRFLECDDGTEFKNIKFRELLHANNIQMYSNFSDKGACIVERFNRTLMTRVHKWMSDNNSKAFINALQDIVDSYNHSYHQTIKCSPISVTKFNESDVWRNIYKDITSGKIQQKQSLHVGDFVRIKQAKGVFSKGYTQNFSNKTYRVSEVVRSIPVTYKISDGNNLLLGTFYSQELSKVIVS